MTRFTSLCTALALSFVPSAACAQVSIQQVSKAVDTAGNSVIAYLPDLQNMPLAQGLKQAAQRNLPVTILTTRKAHMIQGSYLLSVALSNAQTPPRPLKYAFVNLDSPAIIVIDRVNVYYGSGLITGVGPIQKGSASFAQQSLKTLEGLSAQTKNVPARVLVEERFGLSRVPAKQ